MKTLKSDWLIWIIILVPYFFVAWFWDKFPDQVPTHFGLDGAPDDYSSKVTGLLLFPGINILMYFLFLVLPKIDPRKKNYALFADKYKTIRLVLHSFLSFTIMTTIFFSLGYQFNMNFMILYGVLVLFLILGNLMGNVRHNYFVGVRTPWTLANEEVWIKTHRLTAKVWVFGTLITMAILPFLPETETFFGIYIGVITVIPIVYSYFLFRKINDKKD